MKKCTCLFAAIVLAATAAPVLAQADLALWTFETSQPATAGPFVAEGGINGAISQAMGSHAGASTYSTPAGNGSAHSFSSNTWAVNDYYQFSTSSTGYSGIVVSWSQTSSNTGPRDFVLQYSSTGPGGPFTQFGGTMAVMANLNPPGFWNSTTAVPAYNFSVDLSSVAALNNAASIVFRLVNNSTASANSTAPVAAGGTDRVDNFLIHANVPEPVSLAFLGLGGLLIGRRRRA